MNNNTTTNPFVFTEENNKSAESRKLDYTPALIALSNTRAQDLMVTVSKEPELFDLANKALDEGIPSDLIELIQAVYNEEQIKTDSKLLDGCDENQLSRLLESRRSDRSKAKKKNPRSNVQVCKTYISSMYAELLIREYWQKPYTGSTGSTEIDYEGLERDQDALSRKVKSLQSKKSRLGKIAQYDPEAYEELQEVIAEIDRLNALRPSVRATVRTVIKDIPVDQLREILSSINPADLPEDEQAKLLDMMAKLG